MGCFGRKRPKPGGKKGVEQHRAGGLVGHEGRDREPGELVQLYSGHGHIVDKSVMRLAYGISGKPKLLTYDLKHLVKYGGLLTSLHMGTILRVDDGVIREFIKLMLVFGAVALVCMFCFPPDELKIMDTKPLENFSKYMNGFVPFVLTLYVSLALSRWWALRVHALGNLFDAVANTVMLISCVLPGPRHKVVRDLVVKWGVASIFLLVRAARFPEDRDLGDLRQAMEGKLSEEEVQLLDGISPYGRAMVMWAWIMRLAQETFSEADGPGPHAPKLAQVFMQCLVARDGVQTIHTYLQTQLPFAYVHLITLIVNVNNLVVSSSCGFIFTVAWAKGNHGDMCYQLLMFALPILYHGLLSISYVIHDPFGEDMLDFPIAAFVEYVAECCDAVLVAQDTYSQVDFKRHRTSTNGHSSAGAAARGPVASPLISTGATAAATSAATKGTNAAAQVATQMLQDVALVASEELTKVRQSLVGLHDAFASSELRRKRDAERLTAAFLRQGQPPPPLVQAEDPAAADFRKMRKGEPWCLHVDAAAPDRIRAQDLKLLSGPRAQDDLEPAEGRKRREERRHGEPQAS